MTEMRLQRALARAGVASRRAAEELIRAGRVKVNGTVAVIGMKVNADTDVIIVGRRRVTQVRKVWIALHKPVGYVVTKRDPQRRQTVFEMVPDVPGLVCHVSTTNSKEPRRIELGFGLVTGPAAEKSCRRSVIWRGV